MNACTKSDKTEPGNHWIFLKEDPLLSDDTLYLEKILDESQGYLYLNAIQSGPMHVNFGVPTNSDAEPLNKYLPGGNIIRQRYPITEIEKRYKLLLKKGD